MWVERHADSFRVLEEPGATGNAGGLVFGVADEAAAFEVVGSAGAAGAIDEYLTWRASGANCVGKEIGLGAVFVNESGVDSVEAKLAVN